MFTLSWEIAKLPARSQFFGWNAWEGASCQRLALNLLPREEGQGQNTALEDSD